MSWLRVDPSPFRGWVRWVPRSWPGARLPHFDLVCRRIVWQVAAEGPRVALPEKSPPEPGVVYLPPVEPGDREAADELANRLAADGFALVAHGIGDRWIGGRAERWIDPVAAWLDRTAPVDWCRTWREQASELRVALPLVPGLTPQAGELESWIDAVAESTPAAVVAVRAELGPSDRRRLVETLGEGSFDAVFHGSALAETEVARLVAARGVPTLGSPPAVPGLPPRIARNRELACGLAEAAELALRLGSPESECAAFFAAARHLEASSLDVSALGREGNLGVLDWLAPAARELVSELLSTGSAVRLDELRQRWNGTARR